MSFTKECNIIMPTCDKYLHLLKGNVHLVEKFWSQHPKVFVLGFKTPDFEFPNDKWEFISLGEDQGKNSWTNELRKFFNQHGDKIGDYFMHMNDDAPPMRKVDHDMIEYMFDYMKGDETIGRVPLAGARGWIKTNPRSFGMYTKIEGAEGLGEVPQNSQYRTSISNDIWKKEFFMKYLKPNLSSWSFETKHPKNDGYRIVTTSVTPPIILCHVYRQSGFMCPNWFKSKGYDLKLDQESKDEYMKLTGLDNYSGQIWKK
jgi:hypothetical protein